MTKSIIIYAISAIVLASLATPLRGQVAESPAFDAQKYLFTSIDFVDSLRGWHPPEDSSGVFSYGIDFIDPLTGWGAGGRFSMVLKHLCSVDFFLTGHQWVSA